MASSDVTINIRTRGSRQAAREAQMAASSIGRIGTAAAVAGRGMTNFRRNTDLSQNSLYLLRRAAYTAGAAVTGLGVLAVKSGIQFNASMEQNEVAFTGLLGSARAARRELQFLYKTAASTPFETQNITTATRQLLAYGFSARQANTYLGTIGDAIAGSGGGAEQIDSLVRAIGQIRGKGTLQAEELQQIGELGILNRGRFAKNLGITTAALADAGNQGIGAARALAALKKTLDETFGGASAKQARTFNGQMSTLRDNFQMTLGAITHPAFASLEKKWLPALGATTTRINQIFRDPKYASLSFDEKIKLSETVAKQKLGPLVRAAEATVRDMRLGDKLSTAFEHGAERIIDHAPIIGSRIATAIVKGWVHAGPWGKLISAIWLGRKIAGGGLGLGGMMGVRGPVAAGTLANPIAVINEGGGGLGKLGKFGLGAGAAATARKVLPKLLKGAKFLGPIGAALGFLADADPAGGSSELAWERPNRLGYHHQRYRGQVRNVQDGFMLRRGRGLVPDIDALGRMGVTSSPAAARRFIVENHVTVEVDKRAILRAVKRAAADEKARR